MVGGINLPSPQQTFLITLSGKFCGHELSLLCAAAYFATSKKVSLKFSTDDGEGDNFVKLTLEKSQIITSQFSRKRYQNLNILEISSFCSVT